MCCKTGFYRLLRCPVEHAAPSREGGGFRHALTGRHGAWSGHAPTLPVGAGPVGQNPLKRIFSVSRQTYASCEMAFEYRGGLLCPLRGPIFRGGGADLFGGTPSGFPGRRPQRPLRFPQAVEVAER